MCFEIDSWQERIKKYFNQQEGQPYPCSNQIVTNGFFTKDEDKWKQFLKNNKIKEYRKNNVLFENGERWYYFNHFSIEGHIRGFRFYKIKVDKTIDRKFLKQCILPCCNLYCCDFEWI